MRKIVIIFFLYCQEKCIFRDGAPSRVVTKDRNNDKPSPLDDRMARKYIKDYRLTERMDGSGRIRTNYEYIGAYYRYAAGAEAVRREKRRLIAACVIGWAAFAGGLLPTSEASRAVYAVLPYLFAALPLGLLTGAVLTAMPKSEPLRHQQADILTVRYPPAALWTAILAGAAILGALVRLLVSDRADGGDIAFFLCAAILVGVGLFAYSRRGRLACREAA